MLDQKVKSIRALERGLDVLLELQRSRGRSLDELHKSLGLPKATLLRLLVTLSSRDLIWRRLADGAYMPSLQRAAVGSSDMHGRLAEIASPLLAQLSEKVHWPSVIAVPRLDHVEIVETNSPMIGIDAVSLGPVGVKLSYLHTATGRAYLAACGAQEREAIIARRRPPDASADSEATLNAIVRDIKRRGYSTRKPSHPWPDKTQLKVKRDGRQSIAVAVSAHGQAIAAINITWPGQRATVDQIVARCLPKLRETALQIGALAEAVMR
jgi:IclR family mhp operon transcriptional activator